MLPAFGITFHLLPLQFSSFLASNYEIQTDHSSIFISLREESLILTLKSQDSCDCFVGSPTPPHICRRSFQSCRRFAALSRSPWMISHPQQFFLFIAFPSSFHRYRYEAAESRVQKASSLLLTARPSGALRLPLAKSFGPFLNTGH